MSQLTRSAMSGLGLNLRRTWTHSLLPVSDAMYKAVWPSYIYVKGQTHIHNKYRFSISDIKVLERLQLVASPVVSQNYFRMELNQH